MSAPEKPFVREWSWDTDKTTSYTAIATLAGIEYVVILGGPSGGPGGAGYQSYEQLLADGPLNAMPAAIVREAREHAQRMSRGVERARLHWLLEVAPSGMPVDQELAYVSAAINDTTVIVRILEVDSAVLFDGSLPAGPARLSVIAGFGRPWRRSGARTARYDLEVSLAATSSLTISCIAQPDFTLTVRTS